MPVRMKYPGRRATGCAVVSTGGGWRCRSRSPRLRKKTRYHGSSSHNSAGGLKSPSGGEVALSGVAGPLAEGSRWGPVAVLCGIILDRGASTRIIAENCACGGGDQRCEVALSPTRSGVQSEEHTSELQSLRH